MTHAADAASTPRVTVVILNWNGWSFLGPCLRALEAQTYTDFEAVVVDNGSSDGSAERIGELFPLVRLIRNAENRGFAAANNQAIRATTTDYVATLNNDTEVDPGWLQALVEAADADAGVGAVASKMVFQHAPDIINSCGIALDRAGIAWDLYGGQPTASVMSAQEVFGACAGAALYRRAMLDDIGLFDEDFFAYMEDVDLAWRARIAGWRAVLAPNALVRHVHSGTLGDSSPRKRFLLGRNKVWLIAKCLPARDAWSLLIAGVYDLGAIVFRARAGDWSALASRAAGLVGLPHMLAKRPAIHGNPRGQRPAVRYDPLAAPWRVQDRYRHLDRVQTRPQEGSTAISSRAGQPSAAPRHRATSPSGERAPSRGAHERLSSRRQRLRGWLLRAGAKLLKAGPRRHPRSLDGPPRRVVVLRPDHLGDVLLSRPAIELLRASLPDTEITVVVGPWGAASLQGLNCRVVTFPYPGFDRTSSPSLWRPYVALALFAARLARNDFDAALILRPDHWWGALAGALAGIPVRVGQGLPLQSGFLTHAISPAPREPSAVAALRGAHHLLETLGVTPAEAGSGVIFAPSPASVAWASEWLAASCMGRPTVALHPGSGAPVKQWPASRWIAVARRLAEQNVDIVLTGGPGEGALLMEIEQGVTRPVTKALGLSWDQLAGLYAHADLVVGMDSGPLHLAAAVGTPTVRLYGPVDPAVYGPAGDPTEHSVLAGAVPCAPCGNLVNPACGYLSSPPCLAAISVEDVVGAVRAHLGAVVS